MAERLFFVPPHIQVLWVRAQKMRLKAQIAGPYRTSEEEQSYIKAMCSKPRMKMTAAQVISFMRELLSEDAVYQLLNECTIEDKLRIALEKEIYRGNKNAAEVLETFEQMGSRPNVAFTVRRCHLVRDLGTWNSLKGNKEAEFAFNGKNVKVVYIIEEPAMSEKQREIANELGDVFWINYNWCWKIWYNLRPVCHYYVWVGRTTRKLTRRTTQKADK